MADHRAGLGRVRKHHRKALFPQHRGQPAQRTAATRSDLCNAQDCPAGDPRGNASCESSQADRSIGAHAAAPLRRRVAAVGAAGRAGTLALFPRKAAGNRRGNRWEHDLSLHYRWFGGVFPISRRSLHRQSNPTTLYPSRTAGRCRMRLPVGFKSRPGLSPERARNHLARQYFSQRSIERDLKKRGQSDLTGKLPFAGAPGIAGFAGAICRVGCGGLIANSRAGDRARIGLPVLYRAALGIELRGGAPAARKWA